MAKLTEKQRQYFIDRVRDETNIAIQALELKYASTIQKTASKNFNKFLKDLNCDKLFKVVSDGEKKLKENKRQLANIIKGHRTRAENDHYDSRVDDWSPTRDFEKALRNMASKMAENLFESTPGGAKIKRLKNIQRAAIDHIYGMTTNHEVIVGVNKLLRGTNVKLLGE
jgi:hypothetical protein